MPTEIDLRTVRVAVFRAAGRTSRTHAAGVTNQLRRAGIVTVDCGDPTLLRPDHLVDLTGDYHAVIQIGEGAGAAAVLAAAVDIPLLHAPVTSAHDVAAAVQAAIRSHTELAS